MGRLQQLSDSLERARSQYEAANQRLVTVQRALHQNRFELHVAKHNLRMSQRAIAQRLVTLYTTPQDSTIEVVLGAKSLDDMMNRLNTAKSVASLDSSVLQQVEQFRSAVKRNGLLLAHARAEAQQLVAERAAKRREIESQIAQSQHLLASVKNQIAQIEAAQRQRQLQAARQAQLQLEQQRRQQQLEQQSTVVGATAVAPDSTSVAAPPSQYGGGVVGAALAQVGKPYVWAAAGPDSFDCSGLVMYAYEQVGVSLPHSSYAQYALGVPVSQDQLEPGDLVFFDGLGHVGIYIGGGQFVHAPHTGTVVQISSLADWGSAYVGARRIL